MSQPNHAGESAAPDERVWEQGWEGHELAQRQRMARLTFAQKLEWLEEAQRVAEALAKSHSRHAEFQRNGAIDNASNT
jgi:hypothetical protein